eukprot:6582344-Alexandrium_andersonii.AAC.1
MSASLVGSEMCIRDRLSRDSASGDLGILRTGQRLRIPSSRSGSNSVGTHVRLIPVLRGLSTLPGSQGPP